MLMVHTTSCWETRQFIYCFPLILYGEFMNYASSDWPIVDGLKVPKTTQKAVTQALRTYISAGIIA